MKFPTTYPAGAFVQIISAAEFDALKDDAGYARFPSSSLPNVNADYIPPKRRSLCGSIMQIAHKFGATDFYFLKPYDLSTAVDPSAAARFSWDVDLFTYNEFHPYDTPVPISPVSFDDFLKGGI